MDNEQISTQLKKLPQVEEVLRIVDTVLPQEQDQRKLLADAVRSEIGLLRTAILAGETPEFSAQTVAQQACRRFDNLFNRSLRRVINATGVVIHTNLGRSVMAPAAIEAVNDVMKGYSTLEYSVDDMARGSRHSHCERLLCALTGAEAAIAVNNNAAAVVLVLSEFAEGREAIVSRGELIELGESFRIPEIMAQSHAHMVEVGTTNKTHAHDYARAVNEETAMMLKVHKSNYRIVGFTQEVELGELRAVADNHEKETGQRVLVYEDQGSGSFVKLDRYGNFAEPTVAESLANGADLVSFSGDKLLGGPQCGIICGSKELIGRLKKNPWARIVRLDKMTLAALEGTLQLYMQGADAVDSIPTVRMLSESADTVRVRAERLQELVEAAVPAGCVETKIVEEISRAGGGSLPMYDIDTYALEITPLVGDVQDCEAHLIKKCPVPIVARISRGTIICDPRTLLDDEEMQAVAQGFKAYFETLQA